LKNKSRSYFNAKVYKIPHSSKESKGGGFTAYEAVGKRPLHQINQRLILSLPSSLCMITLTLCVNEIFILFWNY